MVYSPIVTPNQIGSLSRSFSLGTASFDIDELYSPGNVFSDSVLLNLASPKYYPNVRFAFDRSGYDNHGTITGALWEQLPNGRWVLLVDGVDDLINCGSAASLDSIFDGTGGSVEAWVNLASDGELDNGRILSKGEWYVRVSSQSASKLKIELIVNSDGSPSFGQWQSASTEITINTWTHLVITYEIDLAANNPIVYLNNSVVTMSKLSTYGGTRDSDTGEDFIVGNSAGGTDSGDGKIGEVRVYNRILSPPEIQRNYTFTKWRFQ